jgi:vancomycin permeability regulator SanA
VQPRFIQLTASKVRRAEILAGTIPRALALFFGGFTLLNLVGNLLHSNFDANLWWIDLRSLPEIPARLLLLLASLCLIGLAVRAPRSVWRRVLTVSSVGLVAATSLWNTIEFYYLLAHGLVRPLLPLPLSLLVFAALILILRATARPAQPASPAKTSLGVLTILALCLVGFPVAQMVCFGNTDYRRPADVAVVFGARAYADGRPSDALADRVRTACQLYRDGLVKKLIFSGGPGDGSIHETESMRRMAVGLGVKPGDILTDTDGLNTQATVKNTEALFARLNAHRILVVSHFYHLPRIKLAYQRTGWDVYTVPARESYFLRQIPYSMAREIPAMWIYYLRPLLS